jgi:hypothetical protein
MLGISNDYFSKHHQQVSLCNGEEKVFCALKQDLLNIAYITSSFKGMQHAKLRVESLKSYFIRTIAVQTLGLWAETRRLHVVFTCCNASVMRFPRDWEVGNLLLGVPFASSGLYCTFGSMSLSAVSLFRAALNMHFVLVQIKTKMCVYCLWLLSWLLTFTYSSA